VGEIRDRETAEIGLTAAETGHLVFSTLHTVDAGQTINRFIGLFDQEDENQVRVRLADTVRWVASQRLLPKVGGGRIAAFEIMSANLRVKDAILNGESEGKTFYEMIQTGNAFHMMTFDQSIMGLYKEGLITEEAAMSYASRKAIVNRGIDAIKSARGEKTTTIENLTVDTGYGKKGRP
jgi:twitching motility protein PilT